MGKKLNHIELEEKVKKLQKEAAELKQAEKALLESEQKYRNLVENIPDVIYSIDTSLTISAINLPASEFYGFGVDEVLGNNFLHFVHPEDKDRIMASFVEAIETHREWTRGLQFRVVSKDGIQYWIELNSHMQFDENGNFKREEGVIRDINDRKKAEEALKKVYRELEERIEERTKELVQVNKQLNQEIKERMQTEKELKNSEERLNIMFEYAPDAYFLNSPSRKIIDGNKAAERLTGYKREELVGKDFVETGLLSEDQSSKALSHFEKSVQGISTGPVEYILCCKDSTKVYVEINTYPVRIKEKDIFLEP
ncbi:MAG: PAS domain S-box protein [Deltaproteobacteria bacterium]|nr:PAS domain S-box protein [Deltaproteobacteria bacterium]